MAVVGNNLKCAGQSGGSFRDVFKKYVAQQGLHHRRGGAAVERDHEWRCSGRAAREGAKADARIGDPDAAHADLSGTVSLVPDGETVGRRDVGGERDGEAAEAERRGVDVDHDGGGIDQDRGGVLGVTDRVGRKRDNGSVVYRTDREEEGVVGGQNSITDGDGDDRRAELIGCGGDGDGAVGAGAAEKNVGVRDEGRI